MKADINIIAEKCNVSKATVSRVFTRKAGVSQVVRERILKAARELNYAPEKVVAQENICIVSDAIQSDNKDEFYYILTANLVAAITCYGYTVKIVPTAAVNLLFQEYTKVIIFLAPYREEFDDLSIPLLVINQDCNRAHSICLDHAEEIEQAVAYLVKNGHRKIALVQDNDKCWGGVERHRGYLASMAKHNLPPLPEFCYQENNFSMIEIMAKVRCTTATAVIVCGEGLVAETNYAMHILGIKIPDDLSLITFEQKNFSKWLIPPHTTINQDIKILLREIMTAVSQIVRAPLMPPIKMMLKSELVIRDTVKNISSYDRQLPEL